LIGGGATPQLEKRFGMRERAMSNIRNWTCGVLVAALILLGPVIAFAIIVTAEMVTDLVVRLGATAIWPVAAVAVGWAVLRKFGGQFKTSQLRSEGA
jgi:hypothetical protein